MHPSRLACRGDRLTFQRCLRLKSLFLGVTMVETYFVLTRGGFIIACRAVEEAFASTIVDGSNAQNAGNRGVKLPMRQIKHRYPLLNVTLPPGRPAPAHSCMRLAGALQKCVENVGEGVEKVGKAVETVG